MIIQHNVMALNAHRQLGGNTSLVSKNLEKLSSGYRINRAGDDAAGLAVSEKMRAQITGLDRAKANAQDGISLVQTAEGALTEVHSMLNRMVELSTQAANGTLDTVADGDRQKIQDEVDALVTEIDRISQATDFNGIKLLDGSLNTTVTAQNGVKFSTTGGKLAAGDVLGVAVDAAGVASIANASLSGADISAQISAITPSADNPAAGKGVYQFTVTMDKATATAENYEKWNGVTITVDTTAHDATVIAAGAGGAVAAGGGLELQIGDTADAHNKVTVEVGDMGKAGLGIDALKVNTQSAASDAIKTVKNAINTVSKNRSKLGALQNRLEHTINNLGVTSENMTAAESRIRDVDMASEMMKFTKNNVLTQAAQAMLAQANQQPQQILQLLR